MFVVLRYPGHRAESKSARPTGAASSVVAADGERTG
jgi:hypothetical protein